MKRKITIIKNKRSIFFLLLLAFPMLQGWFSLVHIEPLKGAIDKSENIKLSIPNWFSGEYQEKKEKYLNESFGFRSFFVRLNNQIRYSLFDKVNARSVIIGKQNYLYEENYIKTFFGEDFIGSDSILKRTIKLKLINDTLAKLNKNLIIVIAAGKGTFYPEYIPDRYITAKETTNYECQISLLNKYNLNYIDFNDYFIKNKYSSKYPLYPQYGIHWSYYGMCLAADSIIKFIEKVRGIDMPNIYWNKIKMSSPKFTDYDLGDGLNLLFKLKHDKLAYPELQFESDSNKTKPSVLVISDSFYWGLYNLGLYKTFSSNQFRYYNKQLYDPKKDMIPADQQSISDAITQNNIIIILATDANIHGLGWGFIEDTYDFFFK